MRRLTSPFWLLEWYALLLAMLQLPAGVRTDEAKYLLSIPYPHPPLLRFLFASLQSLPAQEWLLRFLLCSIVVQAVWLLVDLAGVLTPSRRFALALAWLFSSAVMVQAGTIMMAPITAVFGLVCLWLALRPEHLVSRHAWLIGCFWLLGLFSAYQTVLFAPLLVSALRGAKVSWSRVCILIGLPLALLSLYTLGNPLALASLVKVGGQDIAVALDVRMWNILWLTLSAGSGMLTIVGLSGVLTSGRMDLLSTAFLVLAFVAISSQPYYAILLTPLLCGGLFLLFCKRSLSATCFIPAHVLLSMLFLWMSLPPMHPTPARATMTFLRHHGVSGDHGPILIDGPFGHEWQYESHARIGRFTDALSLEREQEASAIVCTRKTCEEDIDSDLWERLQGASVEIWKRK